MSRSKYNVTSSKDKRTFDGIVFDSEVEMKFYRDYLLPKYKNGEIRRYELQKTYSLQPSFEYDGKKIKPITYVADFYIEWENGSVEAVDVKGFPDSVARMKRKMMWYLYPELKFSWYVYSKIDGGFCTYEYVQKQRAIRKKQRNKKKIEKEKR